MPKVSSKPDKPLYMTTIEDLGLTRERTRECIITNTSHMDYAGKRPVYRAK